jgi:hypothetical protein
MSSAVPPVNPMGTPFAKGSPVESYPITSSGTTPFFPPVCLRSHWDPTKIYDRTVPTSLVALPVDFRPYAKICLEYRTTAPEQRAPEVPDDVVFPGGGEVYPPTRYLNNIDDESLLRRLDRPLGTCDGKQYTPNRGGDMYVDRLLVPASTRPPSRFVEEISQPQALLRSGPYHCRAEADQRNWDRSTRLFNNSTKQDRYKAPPAVEPPRQNIWGDARRCPDITVGTKEMNEASGCTWNPSRDVVESLARKNEVSKGELR